MKGRRGRGAGGGGQETGSQAGCLPRKAFTFVDAIYSGPDGSLKIWTFYRKISTVLSQTLLFSFNFAVVFESLTASSSKIRVSSLEVTNCDTESFTMYLN